MSKNEPGRKVSDQNKLVSLVTFANSVEKENLTVYTAWITYRVDVCLTENLPYIQPYPISSLPKIPPKKGHEQCQGGDLSPFRSFVIPYLDHLCTSNVY